MSEFLIATMESVGAVAFFLAILWGVHNSLNEADITVFWAVYSFAAVMGMGFSTAKALEWFGYAPVLMDMLQPVLGIVLATMLFTTALICAFSSVERSVK